MALDDKEKLSDLERQKLLEEIRKRAEEAELKRIEDEEQKASLSSTSSPFHEEPSPQAPPESIAIPSPEELRIKDLRDKLSIAIDRGKLDKAEGLLAELSDLVSDSDEVDSLSGRVQKLRKDQQEETRSRKRSSDQRSKEDVRAKKEAQQKKITALLEKANDYYQGEKYDRAQETLDSLFEIEPENEDARQLLENITKAKELAQRIREEESQRKAQEAVVAAPPPAPSPPPVTAGDAWGSRDVTRLDDELGLPPVAEGIDLPKPSISERFGKTVSEIHFPWKTSLVIIGILALAASAYLIVTNLKQAVFPAEYSLLVVPASIPGGDNSTQFLADAVTEELINDVAVVNDLRVIAPVTALSLSTYTGDMSRVARGLGANYFLQWNVARVNPDQLSFQMKLSDTLSSQVIWSTQRQSSMRELQSAIREIGQSILKEMKITPHEQEEELLKKVSSTSGRAYEAYAHGRWLLRQHDVQSVEGAITSFEEAIDLDSLFLDAHLGLAWSHLLVVELSVDSATGHIQAAFSHLGQALALGARSAEAYRIRGVIAQYQSQYDRAVEELERGAAFAPSDAETQRRLAVACTIKGKERFDDALKAAMRAASDDPRNPDSYTVLGMIQYMRGENEDALRSLEQGLHYARDKSKYASEEYSDLLDYTHQPEREGRILTDRAAETQSFVDYYKLGRFYQSSGQPKQQWETTLRKAKTLLEQAVAANSFDAFAYSYLALVETRLGSFKNALEASQHARTLGRQNLDVLYNTARMYALQSDKEHALEYLGRAIEVRYRLSSILDMDFYVLRSEPEFQNVVTR